MRAGEEQAVDPLRQQRGADRAGAHQRDEHVVRHAGLVQQAGDLQAGERGVFGRLVEHGVAGQQRRHDHVAADEPGVVPGRDVADHARAAHARCAPSCRLRRTRFRSRSTGPTMPTKKSMRASRPLSSLRDIRIGLPVSRVMVDGERFEVAHHAVAEARDAGLALRSGRAAQAGCAARAASALTATQAASSAAARRSARRWPGCGWQRWSWSGAPFGWPAPRPGSPRAAPRRRWCRSRIGGIPGAIARPPDRAGRRRCGGSPRPGRPRCSRPPPRSRAPGP